VNIHRTRIRIRQILTGSKAHDRVSGFFNTFIVTLIVLNIVAFILQSEPASEQRYGGLLEAFEFLSMIIFTVEYLLRLSVCSTLRRYRGSKGILRFALSPLQVTDLVAIIPFYLPFLGIDLRVLRVLRLFLLFRIFKINRYAAALGLIRAVVLRRKEELLISTGVMLVLLLLASTLMYYAERNVQPDKFGSIPAAMWWAVITMTTVGYGDVFPLTACGRIICAFSAVAGVGFFALPISILGSGFIDEINRRKALYQAQHPSPPELPPAASSAPVRPRRRRLRFTSRR